MVAKACSISMQPLTKKGLKIEHTLSDFRHDFYESLTGKGAINGRLERYSVK